MINEVTKNELVGGFIEGTNELFAKAKDKFSFTEAMQKCDVDGIRDILRNVQNIMIGCIPEGIQIPKVSLFVHASGAEVIKVVKVSICNTRLNTQEFKFTTSFTDSTSVDFIFDYFQSIYVDLLVNELVNINLNSVNTLIADVVAKANINYSIKVVAPLGCDGKTLSYISDDEIVFVADEGRVFDLDDVIVLFDEPRDGVTEDVIAKHVQALVDELETVQSTAQLAGIHGGSLISYVCDISKRLKPATLIKKVCNKNLKTLVGNTDTLAYYNQDGIFSIVERKDGEFSVVLSPINLDTLLKEDFDVLSTIS